MVGSHLWRGAVGGAAVQGQMGSTETQKGQKSVFMLLGTADDWCRRWKL